MPDLPSGTVTFLFTDIEGSTRRWQQDPVVMAQAVARHLTLLREAVAQHGGVLFKVVGDATQSAFPAAPAALATALAAQQAFHGEPWPEPISGLSVRMALLTGKPSRMRRVIIWLLVSTAWPACSMPGTGAKSS
jgi:class 3 adenylate cyclase